MFGLFAWLDAHPALWPLFIFCARIGDVSIGTMRTISVVRGHRLLAALLGFCEVSLWLATVSGVLAELRAVKVLAYAAGFAAGNAAGIWIEGRLALGHQVVRLISPRADTVVATALRASGLSVVEVPATTHLGAVGFCIVTTPRRRTKEIVRVARGADPAVIITIEDVRTDPLPPAQSPLPGGWRSVRKRR